MSHRKTKSTFPTAAEIVAHLDTVALGQDRAKRILATAAYHHYLSLGYRDVHDEDLGRQHVLLIGPTGSGKTLLVKHLAEFLDVPFLYATATNLVETGYKGDSVESLVRGLLERAGGDARLAERGIIFIDELDKIHAVESGGHRDVSGEGVQNSLLTLLDGRISTGHDHQEHEPVDTSRLLFLGAGAFSGLSDIVEQRVDSQAGRMGFGAIAQSTLEPDNDRPVFETLERTEPADLIRFGMIPELIGRFSHLGILHELTTHDLISIMTGGIEFSALRRAQIIAQIHGIELELTPELVERIAIRACELKTGARGLTSQISTALEDLNFRWPELADARVSRVIVDSAAAFGEAEPQLIRGKRRHRRTDVQMRKLLGDPNQAFQPHTKQAIRKLCDQLLHEKLQLDAQSEEVQDFWQDIELETHQDPAKLLTLLQDLIHRDASLHEFFEAFTASETEDYHGILHLLEYQRICRKEDLLLPF